MENNIKTIDARGKVCPIPLILCRKGLNEVFVNDKIKILIDNRTSFNNVMTFLTDLGANPESIQNNEDYFEILATKPEQSDAKIEPASYCNTGSSDQSFIVVLASDKMGDGDTELGLILMKAFVNSLHEQSVLPSHILLYNSGALLAKNGSGVEKSLVNLESLGVRVMVCGTCVNFYEIADKLAVGLISNMYTLTEIMAAATRIVKP